ncbi:Phosphatidyl synthase [Giardia muris]|uniref:Phosphatidyl synthase n=1 Tax=Giardia muris TaxID=5742 RepID=A0A4Z1T0K5_GIAMU|nr:Phosphatidyl synthase [Giardia muris]|eukprot:TNJ30515.1 Phosphatidyl synthase [Giardia muris]
MSFGFALDVDGVLRLGATAAPGAADALRMLDEHNVPFIIVSNSGIDPPLFEQELERQIGYTIPSSRIINAGTTVIDYLVEKARGKTILVVGAPVLTLPLIKRAGHQRCVYTMQVAMKMKGVNIQGEFDVEKHYKVWLEESGIEDKDLPIPTASPDFPSEVDEILFAGDSNTWYVDIQVIMDALLRNGVVLREGKPRDSRPEIYAGNTDISYGANYVIPRLTLGTALEGLVATYKRLTNRDDLVIHRMGKPYSTIFTLAHRKLDTETTYMIGDSLLSDIPGANGMKDKGWHSVLVFTGQTKPDMLDEHRVHPERIPTYTYADIGEAVTSLLKKHGVLQ